MRPQITNRNLKEFCIDVKIMKAKRKEFEVSWYNHSTGENQTEGSKFPTVIIFGKEVLKSKRIQNS